MRKTVIAAALLATGITSSAFAQSSTTPFSGLYFGGQVGYDSYKADYNVGGISGDFGLDGIQGGIFAGYNFRMDNFVLGLEGQFGLSDADSTFSDGIDTITTRAKESYSLTARAGALITDSTLAYVHGGWVKTKFKISDGFVSDSGRLDGWKLGVGLETLISETVSLRAEYAYSDYENTGIIEPKNSAFQLGLAWHF